jgi:hypothetical protein
MPPVESNIQCIHTYLGVCLVEPPNELFNTVFGFAEFITALALIVVVFAISDARYRFRIAVAPLPLLPISFWSSVVIGILVLFSDVWFSKHWPVPVFLSRRALWQGSLGGLFLLVVLVSIYFAFLRSAKFGRLNAGRYASELYRIILRGDDRELPTIASELARSMRGIVDLYSIPVQGSGGRRYNPKYANHAHNLLLLIGNRKFCRHIASSAPGTAIVLFQRVSETHKYYLPLRQFATNVSTEAIQNTDSSLYHEDEGYYSGFLGYVKPFSTALFGDYRLVEGLGRDFGSPLDIDYKAVYAWNATQLEAYCRVVLITFKHYLAIGAWREHSFALSRAFDNIGKALLDAYKLNDPQTPYFPSDIASRIDAAVNFVTSAIAEIGKINPIPRPSRLRQRNRNGMPQFADIYDEIADLMFKLVLAASYVTSNQDRSWAIQYTTVWSNLFGFLAYGEACPFVQFKLRRLIFDEITKMDFLNYKSARVLGLCLNVLGFRSWAGQSRAERSLQKAIISWTKKNFLKRRNDNPEVATSGFPAGLSFDAEKKRLVKTYAKGLEREAPKVYLDLEG